MNALVILGLVSLVLLTYAVVQVLRHDPRRTDLSGPRSHVGESAPSPWYDHTTAA